MATELVLERDAEAAANAVTAEAGGLLWEVESEEVTRIHSFYAAFTLRATARDGRVLRIAKDPHGPEGEIRWAIGLSLDTFEATANTLAELLSIPGMVDFVSGRIKTLPERVEPAPKRWWERMEFSIVRFSVFGPWG